MEARAEPVGPAGPVVLVAPVALAAEPGALVALAEPVAVAVSVSRLPTWTDGGRAAIRRAAPVLAGRPLLAVSAFAGRRSDVVPSRADVNCVAHSVAEHGDRLPEQD